MVTPDFTEEDFRRIDDYIRDRPNIVLAELTPLTPLPGTDLYAERKGDLLTRNREVFDLAHFVLPTEMPMSRMYRLMARHYRSILWTVVRRLELYRPANWLQRHTPRLLAGVWRTFREIRRAHRFPHVTERRAA